MDVFFITWLGALGYCAVQTVRQYVRQKHVINLLYEGHPEEFLREIDDDIRSQGPNTRLGRALVINKSAGLCYLGRFEEAAALLESLDVRWLPSTFQSLHRNNYLMTLLHLQRWDDARRLVESNPRLLKPNTRARTVNTAMRGTLAIYDLWCGDRARGKSVLGELIKMPDHDHMRAFRLYYLGLALLEEGQIDEAYGHFRLAATLAPYSFLPHAVEQILAHR